MTGGPYVGVRWRRGRAGAPLGAGPFSRRTACFR